MQLGGVSFTRVFAGPTAPQTPSWIATTLPATSTPNPRVSFAARSIKVALDDGDSIYGFGAGSVGTPTRNGQSLRLMNLDTLFYGVEGATYASFPLFWVRGKEGAVSAYLVVSSAVCAVSINDVVEFEFDKGGGSNDVIVFAGSAVDIAADIAEVTGRSFVPPAWALGFHQSRWSYRTAFEVESVAARFRSEEIPLDVIHLDIHYMDEYRVFSWHPERFPDPKALHEKLTARGVRTMAIVDPGVAVGPTFVHDELTRLEGCLETSKGDTFVGKVWPGATVFPDFGKAGVSAAWSKFHRVLIDAGVSGFWNDMNDPVFQVGDVYDPLSKDVTHHDGPHVEQRNLYANQMAAATVQGLDDARAEASKKSGVDVDERPFVLSRSGFCGIQKHSALWTGDNFSSWDQLREGMHMLVHLGLCGVPLVGADIGGFGGRRGKYGIVKTKPASELYVRWLELGALMPFCRVHSVLYGPRQEPWSFSDDVSKHARRILRRRYRMLPYLLSLTREARETGRALWRPLWMHHAVPAQHTQLAQQQFLLGEQLLCAPVVDKGVKKKQVWLPRCADGAPWIELKSGRVFAGDSVVDVDVAVGDVVAFVKGGAGFFSVQAAENAPQTLSKALAYELLAPTKTPSTATLTLEDGVSRHALWTLAVESRDDDGALRLRFDVDSRGFAPRQTSIELRVPRGFSTASIDGKDVAVVERDLGDEDRAFVTGVVDVPLDAKSIIVT